MTVPCQPETKEVFTAWVLHNLFLAGIDALARKELIAR